MSRHHGGFAELQTRVRNIASNHYGPLIHPALGAAIEFVRLIEGTNKSERCSLFATLITQFDSQDRSRYQSGVELKLPMKEFAALRQQLAPQVTSWVREVLRGNRDATAAAKALWRRLDRLDRNYQIAALALILESRLTPYVQIPIGLTIVPGLDLDEEEAAVKRVRRQIFIAARVIEENASTDELAAALGRLLERIGPAESDRLIFLTTVIDLVIANTKQQTMHSSPQAMLGHVGQSVADIADLLRQHMAEADDTSETEEDG